MSQSAGADEEGPKIVIAYRCVGCDYLSESSRQACPACGTNGGLRKVHVEEDVLGRTLARERFRDPVDPSERRRRTSFGGAGGGGGGGGREGSRFERFERDDRGGGSGGGSGGRSTSSRGDGEEDEDRPRAVPIGSVPAEDHDRIPTRIAELDKVLDGGPVKGTCICVYGDPGIGKSSILLQALSNYARKVRVFWGTSEETARDVSTRCERFATRDGRVLKNLLVARLQTIEEFIDIIEEEQVAVAVLDSLQMTTSEEVDLDRGSPKVLVHVADTLYRYAQDTDMIIFLVCHVNKEGKAAGPKTVEHCVHAMVEISSIGDPKKSPYREIAVDKNRHGKTNITGRVEMTEEGLVDAPYPEPPKTPPKPHRVARKGDGKTATPKASKETKAPQPSYIDDVRLSG